MKNKWYLSPYEKWGPHSMYIHKGSHREFLVKHDMPLRCVVICNRFPFKTYYAREVMGAIQPNCTEAVNCNVAVKVRLGTF